MNVTWVRLRGVERQLKRIADALDIILEETYGRRQTPSPSPTGPEPEVLYTDEEADAVREMEEAMRKYKAQPEEE